MKGKKKYPKSNKIEEAPKPVLKPIKLYIIHKKPETTYAKTPTLITITKPPEEQQRPEQARMKIVKKQEEQETTPPDHQQDSKKPPTAIKSTKTEVEVIEETRRTRNNTT